MNRLFPVFRHPDERTWATGHNEGMKVGSPVKSRRDAEGLRKLNRHSGMLFI